MKKKKKKLTQVFIKLFTLIIALAIILIFTGCPASATPDSESVTGQELIQSLSLTTITPVDTTASRVLVSGDVGYAEQEYYHNEIQPENMAELMMTFLRKYVNGETIPLDSTVELPASSVDITLAGGTIVPVAIGASKLRINVTDTDINIYWNTEMNLGGGLVPAYVRVLLKDFTPGGMTDYKDISAWFDVMQVDGDTGASAEMKIFAHYNLETGSYDAYQWAPNPCSNNRVQVQQIRKANDGVSMTLIRMQEDSSVVSSRNSAFGDGTRLAILSLDGVGAWEDSDGNEISPGYDAGETRYYVNDQLVNVYNPTLSPTDTDSFTGADRTFLDNGLAANPPPTDETSFNASGTEYYRLYNPAGPEDFDAELLADTDAIFN